MTAILQITDGTNTVNLTGSSSAFQLVSYTPGIPQPKSGGTFNSPAMLDGRQLTDWRFENNIDIYGLFLKSSTSQDQAAADLRSLLQLLMQSVYYRTNNRKNTISPVYIVRQADSVTNTEYAIIEKWMMPGHDDPFDYFFRHFKMRGLTLTLEIGAWTANPPGTGTATAIRASETFNSQTFGNPTSTTDDVVFIGNSRVTQNLTHVFNFDNSATSYSSNLIGSLPASLFPSSPALNDAVYFGIATSVTGAGPFQNLIFNITTAGTGDYFIEWEYWNGSSWSNLTTSLKIEDHTEDFTNDGILPAAWQALSDWTTTTVNSVTGWWVRARIDEFTSMGRPQISQVYSATWNYIEIESDQVGGDLPALAHIQTTAYARPSGLPAGCIVGLRTVEGSENFTATINLSDGHNPSGITVTCPSGQDSAFQTDSLAAAGRCIEYTPTTSNLKLAAAITLSSTILPDYHGTFRVFLRHRRLGGIYDCYLALGYSSNAGFPAVFTGQTKRIDSSTDSYGFTELGTFTLPVGNTILAPGETAGSQVLRIYLQAPFTPADSLRLHDIILIPTDEWAGEFYGTDVQQAVYEHHVDSIGNPRTPIRSYNVASFPTDSISHGIRTRANGPAILQANAAQRLWFLFVRHTSSSTYSLDHAMQVAKVRLWRNQRYLAPRGNS